MVGEVAHSGRMGSRCARPFLKIFSVPMSTVNEILFEL
jgi:hypothetical protein